MVYLHGQTNPERAVSGNYNQAVDQMSENGNSGNRKQIPQDGIYIEPVTKPYE
jgi:hypothetical protein